MRGPRAGGWDSRPHTDGQCCWAPRGSPGPLRLATCTRGAAWGAQPTPFSTHCPSWAKRPRQAGLGALGSTDPGAWGPPGVPLGSSRVLCSSRGEAAGWGRHCSKPPKETTRLEAQSSGWVAGAPGSCPGQDSGHQLVGLDSTWEQEGHGVTGQGLPSELGTPSGLDVPGALGNAALMSGWHWRHARTLVDKGRGIPLCRPAGFQNSCKQWPSVPSPEGSELAPPSPQPPGGPGALPAAVSRARTHKASPAVPGSVPSVTRSHRPRRHTAHLLHVPCLHAPPPNQRFRLKSV